MEEQVALLSVYDKTGIAEFASELVDLGWKIVASKGTANVLNKANIPNTNVAEFVGGGPILGHRVVTLSRQIHAALLATDSREDVEDLKRLGIPRIDLVCVDLYPLQQEINDPNSKVESVIEKTDIGGPTILRSGAKGRRIVICDPDDREMVITWLQCNRPDEKNFITELAAKAEAIVAEYCLTSARYHSQGNYDGFIGKQVQSCCYGENAWQVPAGLFTFNSDDPLALDKFKLIEGNEPSFMNFTDIDRLIQTITHIAAAFDNKVIEKRPLIAVGCKHGNPCGAAVGNNAFEVIEKMVTGDLQAIFGGIVMVNFGLKFQEASTLIRFKAAQRLLDVVVAPDFDKTAINELKRKNGRCRLFQNLALYGLGKHSLDTSSLFRPVRSGFLRQPNYGFILDLEDKRIERFGPELTPQEKTDVLLAWATGSTSNSNTVTLVKDGQLIGNGVGGQDRVGVAESAVSKARKNRHLTNGAVAYSDSFFPFDDGPRVLATAGINVILTSSGSLRDKDTIKICQENDVKLLMIPDKLGRGFFNH